MIDFKGKQRFADCMQRIGNAGHYLRFVDDGIEVSDEAAVQDIIDAYSLDDAKAWKCAQVLALSAELRNRVIAGKSAGEMASWPIKRSEAMAYAADPATSCQMLTLEAQARGVTLADLVTKVLANSALFGGVEAVIGGVDGKHRDAIRALDSFAAVEAYNIHSGWPEV